MSNNKQSMKLYTEEQLTDYGTIRPDQILDRNQLFK
jgi:hypothetical protein